MGSEPVPGGASDDVLNRVVRRLYDAHREDFLAFVGRVGRKDPHLQEDVEKLGVSPVASTREKDVVIPSAGDSPAGDEIE